MITRAILFLCLASTALAQFPAGGNHGGLGGDNWHVGGTLDIESGGVHTVKSGGTLQTDAGATVTRNATETKGGVAVDSSRQIGRLSWLTTDGPSKTFTGMNMPSTSCAIFLTPATGVSPTGIAINSANSFTVTLSTSPTSNVSQSYQVIPTTNW